MAINFETSDPRTLLATFKKAIDDKKIITWSYDSEGDFTHTPDQWKSKAWMRPGIYQGQLTMNFLGSPTTKIMREVYAVYHGRFIEAMLAHCDKLFTIGVATALATQEDIVSTTA